jgi:predicted DNA-binding helix-hairpin-helix protein
MPHIQWWEPSKRFVRLALEFVTPTEDGRCVLLLKILFILYLRIAYSKKQWHSTRFTYSGWSRWFDINFTEEIIEGLFQSSGFLKNADYTNVEVRVAKKRFRT